ncbi:MAG: hypothetical protein AAF065_07300 [Verrucomicrobiota bacterium]
MLYKLTVEYLLFGLAVVSVILPLLAGRTGLPILNVFGRWIRWFLFGALLAFFLHVFELSFRPAWVHFLTGLAVWFMIETGYNWIAIKTLSRSELPLFPTFQENTDGDEWPADKQFIDLKDWLKSEGFKRRGALKAELFEGTYLRASVYESTDQLTRIQILFLPKRQGGASACFMIQTCGSDGKRLITDNQFLPYGGYYPESWHLVRKPMVGSLKRLLALHHQRVLETSLDPVVIDSTALEELNEQQRILERLNTDIGFLVPRAQQEEEGKITAEGCYRLWKEMWLLAYLGRSVS